MFFGSKKGKFDRFFNRLDRPVEESRPDRQPDRPVDPTSFHLCSAPDPAGGAHSPPPNPPAGFKTILCLVLFFIGPNCKRILSSPHF